jgi:hypothetical protein
MAFCTNCGKPVQDSDKFCGICGVQRQPQPGAVNQAVPTPPILQTAPPAPLSNQAPAFEPETIKFVIPNLGVSKSFGRTDNFTLIVTERRSIFAKLTQEIMNQTVRDARANAAAEGKGFFGKWAAQMKGFNNYAVRYGKFTPDQVLRETPGNFAVENTLIQRIRITQSNDDDSPGKEYGIEFQTATEKRYFKTMYDLENMFKQAYGDAIVR